MYLPESFMERWHVQALNTLAGRRDACTQPSVQAACGLFLWQVVRPELQEAPSCWGWRLKQRVSLGELSGWPRGAAGVSGAHARQQGEGKGLQVQQISC